MSVGGEMAASVKTVKTMKSVSRILMSGLNDGSILMPGWVDGASRLHASDKELYQQISLKLICGPSWVKVADLFKTGRKTRRRNQEDAQLSSQVSENHDRRSGSTFNVSSSIRFWKNVKKNPNKPKLKTQT